MTEITARLSTAIADRYQTWVDRNSYWAGRPPLGVVIPDVTLGSVPRPW